MSSFVFKRDSKGIAEILLSDDVAEAVDALAETVAANLRPMVRNLPVVVESYTTDRKAAKVTIADVQGMILQAKHGVLTQAAASAGLTVKAKRR